MDAGSSMRSTVATIRQSPPLDFSNIPDDGWVKDKTILITGGASGFGAAFLKRWAIAGANVIIGDINVQAGDQLIILLRKETANPNLHFVHCDVTDWQSQVNFFKEAVRLSLHGGIDTVVANAGIGPGKGVPLELPEGLDAANPPPPDLATLNVNLTGVVYTTHLALYWLQRNPGSAPANPNCDPSRIHRDRHLLLIGSLASFLPLPGVSLYGASKHAVLGLFRCLRGTSFSNGVRINLICPYFSLTAIVTAMTRVVLAGSVVATVDSVVEAATRCVADPRVAGRAISVGPKLKVVEGADGDWSLAESNNAAGVDKDLWEVYPHDYENNDQFQRSMIGIYNRATEKRGWIWWAVDMAGAFSYGLRAWWRS